jgi:penicillin-binding protein 1A
MLSEAMRTGTSKSAALSSHPAAGKTGTSQDFRDAWFVGFTGRLVTGVWFGNDDSSPTKKLTGGSLPVEVWTRFMKAAHQGVPPADLPGATSSPLFAPPASMPAAPSAALRQPRQEAGVDGWLLDRLFSPR